MEINPGGLGLRAVDSEDAVIAHEVLGLAHFLEEELERRLGCEGRIRTIHEATWQNGVSVKVEIQIHTALTLAFFDQLLQPSDLREQIRRPRQEQSIEIHPHDPSSVVAHVNALDVEHGHDLDHDVKLQ